MWVMLNHAFLSIVTSDRDPSVFAVRARAKGDLQRVFGDKIEVVCLDARDYAFRAFIARDVVAAAMAEQVARIDYPNFKDSVKEKDRHDTYARVWGVMADFQALRGHGRPYATTRTGKGRDAAWARPQRRRAIPEGEPYAYRDLHPEHGSLFDLDDWDQPPVRARGIHGLTDDDFRAVDEVMFETPSRHPPKPKRRRRKR